MKKTVTASIIGGFIGFLLAWFCMTVSTADRVECGVCGAMVTDWWYASDITHSYLVEVCAFCYQDLNY